MAAFMGLALALGLMATPLQGRAQVSSYGDKTEGENLNDQLPTVLQQGAGHAASECAAAARRAVRRRHGEAGHAGASTSTASIR